VQNFRISVGQASRQEVRLLLVVAFEANTVSGSDQRLKQRRRGVGRYHLSLCEFTACVETLVAGSPLALPISHVVQLLLTLFAVAIRITTALCRLCVLKTRFGTSI
jgi:hypothetical protein